VSYAESDRKKVASVVRTCLPSYQVAQANSRFKAPVQSGDRSNSAIFLSLALTYDRVDQATFDDGQAPMRSGRIRLAVWVEEGMGDLAPPIVDTLAGALLSKDEDGYVYFPPKPLTPMRQTYDGAPWYVTPVDVPFIFT
jgi:GH43 family beta-xylosidase